MRKRTILYPILLLFAFMPVCLAEGQTIVDQFLGNPLLILTIVVVIDIVAFLYHRIRK